MKNINIAIRFFLIEIITLFFPTGKKGDKFRGKILTPLFKSCGNNLRVKKGVHFFSPQNVSIGNNVYFGNYSNIGAGELMIGNEVIIGPLTSITATNHTKINNSYRFGPPKGKKIIIGNGTFIGANCNILAGANIGSGVLIGAGSTIFSKIKDNVSVISKQNLIILKNGNENKED